MTMPILAGTDGRRKMSKSLGNQIGVTDPPAEMYGKVMSLPDEAMGDYYRLLLGRQADPDGRFDGLDARDAKHALARAIVAWLHSDADAADAAAHFERVHVQRQAPEEIPEAGIDGADGTVHVPALIEREFGLSRSQARRLIDQGAVSLGETPLAQG